MTLLGDAAHAMQPNLGQGGCMAIEVCYFAITINPIRLTDDLGHQRKSYFSNMILVI